VLQKRAWHYPAKLDLKAMRAAAKLFIANTISIAGGTRDYEMKSNVRHLTRLRHQEVRPQTHFIIEGDGFLYKMCGALWNLVQVGRENSSGWHHKHFGEPRPARGGMTARRMTRFVESVLRKSSNPPSPNIQRNSNRQILNEASSFMRSCL